MTIEIKDGRYFEVSCFVPGINCDYLAAMFRDPDGPWEMIYRFRYYVDDETHDSDDQKNWYRVRAKDGTDQARERLREGMQLFAEQLARDGFLAPGQKPDWVKIKSDRADVVLKKISSRPTSHLKLEGRGFEPGGSA
jgi:hypothetical protein